MREAEAERPPTRLAPESQRIQSDAIGYLTGLGIRIPGSGNRIGTLRVEASGSSEVSVTARTTTAVPRGPRRPGLSRHCPRPGVQRKAVYLCGLRQNTQDRSNVAFQNMGAPRSGPHHPEGHSLFGGGRRHQPPRRGRGSNSIREASTSTMKR